MKFCCFSHPLVIIYYSSHRTSVVVVLPLPGITWPPSPIIHTEQDDSSICSSSATSPRPPTSPLTSSHLLSQSEEALLLCFLLLFSHCFFLFFCMTLCRSVSKLDSRSPRALFIFVFPGFGTMLSVKWLLGEYLFLAMKRR